MEEKFLTLPENDEDMPIEIDAETNNHYLALNNIFNELFPIHSLSLAKQTSKEERDQKHINDPSFVYGEVTFRSMCYINEYITEVFKNQIIDGNFYDLGSGTGKAVIAMSLIRKFKKCIGIEYLENLTALSKRFEENYNKKILEVIEDEKLFKGFNKKPNILEFVNGDFLKRGWSEASVILMISTCFTIDLINKIAIKANKECKSGCIIISFTKSLVGLNKDYWEFKEGFKRNMTWGSATVYVHRKK